MIVYKGAILTCDAKNTVAQYLVEERGKILYVGDELPERFSKAETVELGERALTPSFVDSHIHFASYSIFHAGLNVMEARTNLEILEMLKAYAAGSREKILLGFGASPYSVQERRLVSRKELDTVCPDRPVFLVKYDGHACIVNTKLLEKVKDKVSRLRGYHEDTGEMNQDAFFAVSDYVTNSIPILTLIKDMQKAADHLASKGIGMIHTVSGVGFPRDLDVDLERWFARGLDNGLQMRVFFQTMDVDKVKKRGLPRVGGCFATALDGCFGSADAALREPYEGTEDSGVLYYTDEQVCDFCKRANRAGLQIEMHAIGDAAFQQATRALKAALDDYPRENHRHGIIHACLPTEEGIRICRDYHILLPVQSAFINWPQEPDAYLRDILGERSAGLNPLRTFQDQGILLSAGSDAPCTEPDPIQWIDRACNHSEEGQSLSVQEALRMCTYGGYYTTFDEDKRGTLEKGKFADMVILSRNPYAVPREELKQIQVEKLMLRGEPYRQIKRGAVGHILKGMCSKNKQ